MSTSGVTTFTMTRNEIIEQAALKIGAIGAGVTMAGQQLTTWAKNLNMLAKQYQAMGLHVWTEEEGTLFMVPGQIRYGVGSGATDHVAQTELIKTTAVTNDTPISTTVIAVDDTTGFVIGYYLGIVLDSGVIFWTTVSSFTATTVTIPGAGLTDSVSQGAAVFCYQSNIPMPLDVYNPRRFTISDGNEVPMIPTSRMDWNNLQSKLQPGDANQLFYDKQRVTGYLNVWQVPTTTIQTVRFTWQKPIEIFTGANDNPDFPEEWCLALVFNLAAIMIPNHAVAPNRIKMVLAGAAQFLDEAKNFDREQTSVQWVPGER